LLTSHRALRRVSALRYETDAGQTRMKLGVKSMIRLAHWTRRADRHRSPIRYRARRALLKMFCDRKRHKPVGRIVMPYDRGLMVVDLSTQLGYQVMFDGYHNAEMARIIRNIVHEGDVCLDVGANVGAYALIMAFWAGATGRVIALEPNPPVAERLLENFAINNLDNACVVQAALTGEDGEAEFYTYDPDTRNIQAASLRPMPIAHQKSRVRTISAETLERTENLSHCDLVKIDVTGAELLVLKALSRLIERCRPYLFIEHCGRLWARFDTNVSEAVEMLNAWQYSIFIVKKDRTLPLEGIAPDRCNLFCVPRREAHNILP